MSHHHPVKVRQALALRIRKIVGQLNAIERRIQDDFECTEVLMQAVSARKALKSFAEAVIAEHMEHCIEGAGDPKQSQAKLKELLTVLHRYVD